MPCAGPDSRCSFPFTIRQADGRLSADARACLRYLLTLACEYVAHRRQRRDLAELDAERLSDIGVSPGNARAEVRKPFWKI